MSACLSVHRLSLTSARIALAPEQAASRRRSNPCRAADSIQIRPLCISMMRLEMASPTVPSFLRVFELSALELKSWRTQQAQEFLRLGVRPDGDTFVCTHADGSPYQPTFITHEWRRLIKGSDLPRLRFHDLRHAHATHLLASGVHPKVASERFGPFPGRDHAGPLQPRYAGDAGGCSSKGRCCLQGGPQTLNRSRTN